MRRLAAELFGARILRREGAQLGASRGWRFARIDVEQFRDPEVHQLRRAVLRHEDVAGFQIAVDDLALMGVGESVEYAGEETHPVFDVEGARRIGQVLAVDEFERQKPVPFVRLSAVEEAGDAGMFERGEYADLVAEAADRLASQAGRIEELERHAPAEALGCLLSEEDAPHAAATDLAQQPE